MKHLLLAVSSVSLGLVACASAEPRAAQCPTTPAPTTTPAAAAPPTSSSTAAIVYDLPKAGEFSAPMPVLPEAATNEEVHAVLVVTLEANGDTSVDDKRITKAEDIKRIAAEKLRVDPGIRAIIRADRAASWGSVVQVIDQLKQGGIAKIAFAVSPQPAP